MKDTPLHPIVKYTARSALLGLACLGLMGCSSSSYFTDGDTLSRNQVEMVRIPYLVTFEGAALAPAAVLRLDNFLMSSNVSYGDELSLDFPLERDGGLSDENQARMTYLTEHLKKRGLSLSPEVTPYGAAPAADQARFLISRYVVTPPRCGDWSEPSTKNYGNASMPNLGCATQASLGLMVANPRDLVVGVSGDGPTAETAAKAVLGYQTKAGQAGGKSKAKKK